MLNQLYDQKLDRFIKALYPDGSRDSTVDSSLSFIFTCGACDANEQVVENTMNAIANQLWVKTDIGGVARYDNDEYQRVSKAVLGNPWLICTLWLARWQIRKASTLQQLKQSFDLLSWATKHSLQSGILPEQLNPYIGKPISVSPLTWSHAEFVIAVSEYLDKYPEISSIRAA